MKFMSAMIVAATILISGCMSMEKVDESRVFFSNLTDGQTVQSPLNVKFGVEGMEVKPAGQLIEGTGHHHLIIDGEPIAAGKVIPNNDTYIHFGGGQTETTVDLSKGEHTLMLQFADGAHRSYGEKMRASIKVIVK
ncbi:MAG: DUF4399 domain-containing protein [Bdellovibrionales bacterium]